jgi:hypothetical protein
MLQKVEAMREVIRRIFLIIVLDGSELSVEKVKEKRTTQMGCLV